MITPEELSAVMPKLPRTKRDLYLPFLQAAMTEFQITSYLREAAFLAQLAHESVQLRYMEEIASGAAYEGRRDLGNVYAGDGRRYKGRGPIQLTGRANYRKYGALLHVDFLAHPELAAEPRYGFRTAGLYWQLHGLNELADQKRFTLITRRINGGVNGLSSRLAYYALALKALSHGDPVVQLPHPQPAEDETTIHVLVDGILVAYNDDPTIGYLEEGHVWAPVRPLAERLKLAVVEVDGDQVVLQTPSRSVSHVPCKIYGSTGMAPVAQVAQAAGKQVTWDSHEREVRIA